MKNVVFAILRVVPRLRRQLKKCSRQLKLIVIVVTEELLGDVAAKLSRAKSKGIIHANTASRKLSRLAKRLNKAASAA